MGKPGKKAGKGMMPPTNVNRRVSDGKTHLRDGRTIKRLKMYTSKIKRNEKGEIVKGSVLSAADRVEKSMARIAPDRRWFGNTRVIGQEALQKFREEMGAKYNDPYSVVLKQSKLPLSLLEEPKEATSAVGQSMQWDATFGPKATRKRARLAVGNVSDLAEKVQKSEVGHERFTTTVKTRQSRKPIRSHEKPDKESDDYNPAEFGIENRSLYKKGQSNRIWNELYKVVDSADVIIYVLDARDPMGTRSPFLEQFMRKEKRYKHFIFVLNKCDLIPVWATARWLQILSKDFPTIAMHSSITHPFGKGNLISLLRQFSRLHNVAHRGSKRSKAPISVGVVGYPNVGKSSVINTLRRKVVCKSAPIPGETKVWQYVALTRSIFLIDSPGVVYDREGNNDVQAVLKGVVRVERMGGVDKTEIVKTVLQICKKEDIANTYNIPEWSSPTDFLEQLAFLRGKLISGGLPDTDIVARSVLYDWQRGKIPWYNAPPFESNQAFREAQELPANVHLKEIEHYTTFNVVDDTIKVGKLGAPKKDVEREDDSDDEEEARAQPEKRRKTEAPASASVAKGAMPFATVSSAQAAIEEADRKEQRRQKRQAKNQQATAGAAAKMDQDEELWEQFLGAA